MSQSKLYVPLSTRTNQYISADLKLTDELLANYTDVSQCYKQIAEEFFKLTDVHQLFNVHVIANDKLPVVRFHTEAYTLQTAEQILFFYDPEHHEAQNLFFDANYRARKLRFLFLATGNDIRANAAAFHNNVRMVMNKLMAVLPKQSQPLKVRDHQQMSYDLFAAAKGSAETYGYKLRNIYMRYKSRGCELPADYTSTAHVKVTLPLSRQLKQRLQAEAHTTQGLYQYLQDHFLTAVNQRHLKHVAMVGNGLTPLVRNSKFEKLGKTAETQHIGFNPQDNEPQFQAYWDGNHMVEAVDFILVATQQDYAEPGYCRYMNQVEAALKDFAKSIGLEPKKQVLTVRFYQHISYLL
ncbi:DUF3083 family protein [Shewanella sp. C32]|uniref:DUF3083 family protein n=1 Tax=Shewanella electrica TaxID=515560 RepID=A0ABT2FHJ1_9GAMM|nr:DUF3083 family protein [Shewanella electrica]MCH1923666.1 DUF3083 family protein [Shewanella electrica]MCS4555761.1 DUF3083 family protein [Shewanella electrica]